MPVTRSHARKMRELLRSLFGLEQLRPGQRAVIDSVLSGRHTLAVMPTGAGKSLCYQLPALLLPGMTVVVSPLIALMRDQHDKLIALGIASAQVNSAVPADAAREAHAQIGDEGTEFFFTTPEQLARPELREKLMNANVDLFVIDEAHCLSQWGHDFRPDYLGLADVVRSLGSPTVLALTATAPPAVAVDIVRQLALPDMAFLTTGAWRENLELAVRHVSGDVDKQRALVDVLRRQRGSGIVYAATIKHVHEIADLLRAEGLPATHYHGRLAARERHANQDAFMRGEIPIMVATNAFGMGIDKADIRFVVHYDLPASLDAYYQEAGRAGRDGEAAACVLLFQRADRRLQAFFMAGPLSDRRRSRRAAGRAAGPRRSARHACVASRFAAGRRRLQAARAADDAEGRAGRQRAPRCRLPAARRAVARSGRGPRARLRAAGRVRSRQARRHDHLRPDGALPLEAAARSARRDGGMGAVRPLRQLSGSRRNVPRATAV
jgi:ATP-dependent DNA helicase RecQ